MIAVVAVERIVTIQEISLSASQNTSLNRQQTVSWAVCQGGEYQSTGTLQHCSTVYTCSTTADDATAAAALAFHTALKDLMWTLAQDNSICYRFRCVVRLCILECSNKARPRLPWCPTQQVTECQWQKLYVISYYFIQLERFNKTTVGARRGLTQWSCDDR